MAVIKVAKDKSDQIKNVAAETVEILGDAIKFNGSASWVLAGGSTPLNIYKYIAQNYSSKIDWSKVYISLGDERVVPLSSEDSNTKLIKRNIIDKIAIDNKKIFLPEYSGDISVMAKLYNDKVSKFLKIIKNRIDLIYLGIGDDGHTLSIFPNNTKVNLSKNNVEAITSAPKLPANRISFSFVPLRKVKNCFIVANGKSKHDVFEMALKKEKKLPITVAIEIIEDNGGYVYWQIDKELTKL